MIKVIPELQKEMDKVLQAMLEDAFANASWVHLGGEWDASKYSDELYALVEPHLTELNGEESK